MPFVDAALAFLAESGTILHYTHQNLAEFWNVSTRPADRNGFGLNVTAADREAKGDRKGGWSSYRIAKRLTMNGAAWSSLTP